METTMLSPDRIPFEPLHTAASDYDIVRRAIGFISEQWRKQPEVEEIAHASGVTATELHHLFRRWSGLTPKAFLQAITLDRARTLLRDSASVLDAAYEVGLSGPGRLHDLFVTHEAMSPGEWKAGGEGLTLHYGYHPSPFGIALIVAAPRGLAGLAFADPGEEKAALADMQRRWPKAHYVEDATRTAPLAQRIFDPTLWRKDQPLRVVLIGTDWEVRVWDAAAHSARPGHHLFRHRAQGRHCQGLARGRRRRRQESDLVRGALPSRARQERQAHRLSLGHHPQVRDAGLGGRAYRHGVSGSQPPALRIDGKAAIAHIPI